MITYNKFPSTIKATNDSTLILSTPYESPFSDTLIGKLHINKAIEGSILIAILELTSSNQQETLE